MKKQKDNLFQNGTVLKGHRHYDKWWKELGWAGKITFKVESL